MNWAYVIVGVVVAVILCGGLAVGALIFAVAPVAPEAPERIFEHREVEPDPPKERQPQPMLEARGDAAQTADLRQRVENLEAQVKQLQAQLAQAREETQPMLDLYKQALEARGDADPSKPPEGEDTSEFEGVALTGVLLAGQLAEKVGLDAGRRAAFEKQYQKTLEGIKELEKRHATVGVEGDTTTISITRFGADGELLRREWSDWLGSNLNRVEVAAFKKEGGDNRLFAGRMGQYERTVKIREAGGNISVTESSLSDHGVADESQTVGPAAARDYVLVDYLHLLK